MSNVEVRIVHSRLIANLKKQSQFAGGQNDAILAITMAYGDLDDYGQRKNKANQSQSKPILGKGKSKKEKGKNENKYGVSSQGYLKKQSQFATA